MRQFDIQLRRKEPMKLALVLFLLSLLIGGVYAKITQNLLSIGIDSVSSRYFNTIKNMDIQYWDLFRYISFSCGKSFFFIWVISLTILGIPYLGWLIISKGFQIGYLLTSLVITYHWKGVILYLSYQLPHSLVYVPVALLCLKYCYQLTMEMNHGQVTPSLHNISLLKKYAKLIIMLLLALFVGALMETFLGSFFIRKALSLF